MRKHASKWQPKGSFPLPDGTHAIQSRPSKVTDGRNIVVTGKLRAEPDPEALAKAFIEVAKKLGRRDSSRKS